MPAQTFRERVAQALESLDPMRPLAPRHVVALQTLRPRLFAAQSPLPAGNYTFVVQHRDAYFGIIESERGYRLGYCVLTDAEVSALASLDPSTAGYAEALYTAFMQSEGGFRLFDHMGQAVPAAP